MNKKILLPVLALCLLSFAAAGGNAAGGSAADTAELLPACGNTSRTQEYKFRFGPLHQENHLVNLSVPEYSMLSAINYVREKNAVPPLLFNREATRVAKYKCEDMARLGYAAHVSPVYGNPADMLNLYAVPFNAVGENIFTGADGALASGALVSDALEAWLGTPAYRKNILNARFTQAGVGYLTDESGNACWVALLFY